MVPPHTDVESGASPQARSVRPGGLCLNLRAGGLTPVAMIMLYNAHKGLLVWVVVFCLWLWTYLMTCIWALVVCRKIIMRPTEWSLMGIINIWVSKTTGWVYIYYFTVALKMSLSKINNIDKGLWTPDHLTPIFSLPFLNQHAIPKSWALIWTCVLPSLLHPCNILLWEVFPVGPYTFVDLYPLSPKSITKQRLSGVWCAVSVWVHCSSIQTIWWPGVRIFLATKWIIYHDIKRPTWVALIWS